MDGLQKREMSSFLTISLSWVTSRGRDEASYENLRKNGMFVFTYFDEKWLRTRRQNIARVANN